MILFVFSVSSVLQVTDIRMRLKGGNYAQESTRATLAVRSIASFAIEHTCDRAYLHAFERRNWNRAQCDRTHLMQSIALGMTCQHARKPIVFSINLLLLFVNPTLGGAVESRNTNFVMLKSLWTFFNCKFRFFMFSIDFDMSVVIMRG